MTKTLEESAAKFLPYLKKMGEISRQQQIPIVRPLLWDALELITDQQARIKELENPWQPIETASKEHQIELLGYDADIGVYNMHWRHEIDSYCYTWNQDVCNPTHWMPLPQPPKSEE